MDTHQLTAGNIPITVSAYGGRIFKIKMGEGTQPQSDAILPQEACDSVFSENECKFTVTAENASVTIAKADGALKLTNKSGKVILETYPEDGYKAAENGGFVLNFRLSDSEHIYGLGEDNDADFGSLDRRGTIRDMITGQRINRSRVTADFPIPFMLSAGGNAPYGIYIDNTYNLTVDVAKTDSDRLSVTAPNGACEFWLIAGETANEVVQSFSALTGRAKLPPLWTLGYMQSKCTFWDWEEIDDAIAAFTDNNIPLDSIVFDFDWAQCFNNYKWADRWQGKSTEKMKFYSEKYGIHFMASNSGPMLKKNSDTFEGAVNARILAHDTEGNTVTCGHYSGELIDFTNPKTEEWLEPQLCNIMDDGIESWWLDLTEPEGESENTVYHLGSKQEIHNVFSNHCTKVYHDIMKHHSPDKRSFVLTRTGTAGIQRNPTALWTGDIFSEYGTLQAHVPEALNTQLSGISMWTCDTGGFLSPTNNAECPYNLYHNDRAEHASLYERWMQFSCFTPIFRSHHAGGEVVPHRFGQLAFDGMARYIKLRYRLIPYIYSLYYQNYLNGTPIMRPLFWHYPKDEKAYTIKDEYLFGENMLVAPVLEEQQCRRSVYLPEGTWYDFDYGYQYGEGDHDVYAPQNRIPVFIKGGAIIPMSKQVTNTRDIDFSDVELMVYPEGKSEFIMYADDGITDRYQQGEYTATKLTCEETDNGIRFVINYDNDKFAVKTVTLHIRMKSAPTEVIFSGEAIGNRVARLNTVAKSTENIWCFDEFNRTLHIKLFTNGSADIEILTDKSTVYPPITSYDEKQLSGQLPFIYPAATVPCKLEGIHYDRGGEGIAYHKLTAENGSEFRPDNAGIIKTESGYAVQLTAGEWLEYTLSVNGSSDYRVVVIGDIANAKIQVGTGSGNSEIINGSANIPIENGEPVLFLEVREGTATIEQIRIEAIR